MGKSIPCVLGGMVLPPTFLSRESVSGICAYQTKERNDFPFPSTKIRLRSSVYIVVARLRHLFEKLLVEGTWDILRPNMETSEPNSHSQSLSSHFSPENYKWLAENIESVAQIAKKIKKITEEDENTSSNKKPEMIAQLQVSDSAPHQASDYVAPMNKPPAPSIIGDKLAEIQFVGTEERKKQIMECQELHLGEEEISRLKAEVHKGVLRKAEYEEELRKSSEKLQLSEVEISRLTSELEKLMSVSSKVKHLQAELDLAQYNRWTTPAQKDLAENDHLLLHHWSETKILTFPGNK
ncbi:hypothetical protein LguiB_011751 [Lonicera macranthoides]